MGLTTPSQSLVGELHATGISTYGFDLFGAFDRRVRNPCLIVFFAYVALGPEPGMEAPDPIFSDGTDSKVPSPAIAVALALMEPEYTFRFRVAAVGNPHTVSEAGRRVKEQRGIKVLSWIWHRIWTEMVGARPS